MYRNHSTLAHIGRRSIYGFTACAGLSCLAMSLCHAEVEHAKTTASEVEEWEQLLGENCRELWRGYGNDQWPNGWKVEDGVLSRYDGGGDIMTKAKYANFELRLEWKISEKGNSGIMYRVRTGDDAPYFSGPEYQVLDNEGHPDGTTKSHTAAALYGLYAPAKDWTKPVGEWNVTRILVRDKHVQHFLNGQKTVDCVIGNDEWNNLVKNSKFDAWKQFAQSTEGHIVLQDHGDLVWYREIAIRRIEKED